MLTYLLLVLQGGLGYWIETHVGETLTIIILVVSAISWFFRLEGKVIKLNDETVKQKEELAELHKSFSDHRTNVELHVNQPYMKTIERRLAILEESITRGFERAAQQLDKLSERLYGRRD
ncbi:MAG: hypothetical protein C4287_23270 [Leptolyngbya sp. ERB_1_2]